MRHSPTPSTAPRCTPKPTMRRVHWSMTTSTQWARRMADSHRNRSTLHKLSFACPRTVSQDGPAVSGFGWYRTSRMRRTTSLFMGMRKARVICCAIRGPPQVGFRCFMSTTAAITSRLGPFGPGFRGTVAENSRPYFRWISARWKRKSVEGFRTMAARTSRLGRMNSVPHAGDHPISETEVGGTPPGAIEHQQLLLDEDGLGHHCPRPARTGEPGECRQKMG